MTIFQSLILSVAWLSIGILTTLNYQKMEERKQQIFIEEHRKTWPCYPKDTQVKHKDGSVICSDSNYGDVYSAYRSDGSLEMRCAGWKCVGYPESHYISWN